VESLGNFPDRFVQEIALQPAAMRHAAEAVEEQAAVLAKLATVGRNVRLIFTGMGASYDACYAPVTVLAGRGREASMVDAAELLHFRLATLARDTVLVAVSQSGESAEVVRLLQSLDRDDRPTIVAVTNGTANAVARAADVPLDTRAGEERGPSTLSFVASLVVLEAVASILGGARVDEAVAEVRRDAERAATAAARLVEHREDLAAQLRSWLGARRTMAIVGRGAGRAASETGSLVLKEAARLPAEALAAAQFRHGPLELAGPDLALAVVATEAETIDLDLALASDVLRAGGAVMIVTINDPGPTEALRIAVGPVGRALAGAVAVIPFQLLAWRLAVEDGLDPGMLSLATKVTTHE
jgi:glucosamine--fructose-6-phosphate aminotransferase (isomerizing)